MTTRLGIAIGCVSLAMAAASAADVSLSVQYDQPGHEISPRLIGVFFEDINFGADGGLNAELVKNGSFEFPGQLMGWSESAASDRQGECSQHSEAPVAASNPTFMRLAAEGGAGWYSVINSGYRGMGLHERKEYLFSAQLRTTAGREARVRLRLVDEAGDELATDTLSVAGSDWREQEATLVPARTAEKARLEIGIDASGTVDIDLVSLYPRATWQNRPHGLRRDLVELLADLQPSFFRFPGGCIVEGSQLKYRYQWKSTIGPRSSRRTLINRWNTQFRHRLAPDYYQSFALGFFEYFQLAEDLHAEPMPIINCGMACQFNSGELVPLDELDPYIQDALDLVEFANGPVSSEWGAKRAEMGHPEPFGMKMLGIGNEQWGPEYFVRYRRFAEVLRAVHPEIELISTSGPFPSGERFDFAWPKLRDVDVDIVDEHCYAMPDWFLREATRYDSYGRDGPEVFMGEYAAQSVAIASPDNRNNLRCALAEAAFLTGIERNSDVVTMSAYAPLMGHEDAWQWRPNLVWCDNLRCYGTPSYYVQKLFSRHRGDVVVPVELNDRRPPEVPSGGIGLGTYRSRAEFKDIEVERDGNTLLTGDELASADQMNRLWGDWEASDGVIHQSDPRASTRATFGDSDWSDYTFSLQARKLRGQDGLVVIFRHGAGGSYIEWNIGGHNNERHTLTAHLASHSDTPRRVTDTAGSIESDRWYDVRVELGGSQVRCYLDDQLVHDVDIPTPPIPRLFAAASLDDDQGDAILKVVNPTDDTTAAELNLNGTPARDSTCRVIELSGDPDDENSIAQPTRISPQAREINVSGPRFTYSFPPHSFTVFRLKTE